MGCCRELEAPQELGRGLMPKDQNKRLPALSSVPRPWLCELHAHLFAPSSSFTLVLGPYSGWNCSHCFTPRQWLGFSMLPPVPSPRVKSPPWIMKSLITRWNLLPLKPNPFWGCGGKTGSEVKGQTRALWPQCCPRAPSRTQAEAGEAQGPSPLQWPRP